MRDKARLCTGKSTRTGKRCRQNCLRKPDGTYTKNCRRHRGDVEFLAPGDPKLGGRPAKSCVDITRLPEAQRGIFKAALGQSPAERIEHLIAFAYGALDAYLAHHGLKVVDGYRVEWRDDKTTTSETIVPHFEVIHRHLDAIRKLEKDRVAIAESGSGATGVDGTEDYGTWLKGMRKSRRRS